MKIHIAEKDYKLLPTITSTLCGRKITLYTIYTIYVPKVIRKYHWCKTCKMLFNANFARKRKLK